MPERAEDIFFSLVVLNWNTLPLLKENLGALGRQTCRNLEVIVVDNGSSDGSPEWLKGEGPSELLKGLPLKIMALPRNLGFTGGMNAGLREARGLWLMPLNVDVFLAPDFFSEALLAIERHPNASMLGPLVFRYQPESGPTEEVMCTHMVPTRLLSLATPLNDPFTEKACFGPAGCAPLFKKEALEMGALPENLSISGQKEYYDDRYFAYGEDTDLYLRLNLLGQKAFYIPALRCHHVHSASQLGVRWHEKSPATIGRLPANAFDSAIKNLRGLRLFITALMLLLSPLAMCALLLWRAPIKFISPLSAYPKMACRFARSLTIRAYIMQTTKN